MATQQIDRQDWTDWLNEWSRSQEGRDVHVQMFGPGTGAHEEAKKLPFAGLIVELDTREGSSITITLGTETDDHISHTVRDPQQVWWKTEGDNMEDVLEIRSSDGTATVLKFAPKAG